MVLLSTHNVCFGREIRKLIVWYLDLKGEAKNNKFLIVLGKIAMTANYIYRYKSMHLLPKAFDLT